MRVLCAIDLDEGEPLCVEAEVAGHTVVRLGALSATDVTARLRRDPFDVLVISGQPQSLTLDVVDACDARGIVLVAVIENRMADDNARECGVSEKVGAWQGWKDIEGFVTRVERVNTTLTVAEPSVEVVAPPRSFTPPGVRERPTDTRLEFEEPTSGLKSEPRVVVVWGPTGAPGRTTVALNVAAKLAERGVRVALVDADTYGGAVAIRLGIFDEAPGIARACRLAGSDELTGSELGNLAHEVRIKGNPLYVVTGILGSTRWPEISRERLDRVIACSRDTFDVVILDVGFSLESDEEISSDMLAPRRNAATHAAIRSATDVIAVAGADSVGLARFIRLWSDLTEINEDARITVCVNNVVWHRDGGTARENITSAFSRFAGIRDVVLIPSAIDLAARADARGLPGCLVDPGSPFSHALTEVTRRVLGESAPSVRGGFGAHIRENIRGKMRGVRLLG